MKNSSARSLSALLAILLLTAGCLSGVPSEPLSSPTSETPTRTEMPGTSTSTPDGHEAAMNQPSPNKSVQLQNEWNRSVEMHVRVVRDATNETVHDETYDLAPGTKRTAYNVSEAEPDGIESFTVVVTARNTTDRVSIETNECYGDAYAEILDDGTVYLYYAIC